MSSTLLLLSKNVAPPPPVLFSTVITIMEGRQSAAINVPAGYFTLTIYASDNYYYYNNNNLSLDFYPRGAGGHYITVSTTYEGTKWMVSFTHTGGYIIFTNNSDPIYNIHIKQN